MKILATLLSTASMLFAFQSCTETKGENPSVPKTSEPVPVKVMTLKKIDHNQEVQTSGYLATENETLLSFKVGGVIREVLVKEGQKVKKGQVLATLDLTEVNATVLQAEAAFQKTSRDLTRMENLYRDSVATLEQLQNARTAHNVAQAQLNTATFNKGFSTIKATSEGFVLNKFVSSGQLVKPGDPVIRTNDTAGGKWILRAGASDRQWTAIRSGDKAVVEVDAFQGVSFDAVVLRKSETVDPASGSFTIELEVTPGKHRFASGMFAAARVITSERSGAWEVPYEAVLDASGDEGFVFVIGEDGKAIRQPVTIDSFGATSIRIENGLENAEALIVSGSAYLTDQSPVVVIR